MSGKSYTGPRCPWTGTNLNASSLKTCFPGTRNSYGSFQRRKQSNLYPDILPMNHIDKHVTITLWAQKWQAYLGSNQNLSNLPLDQFSKREIVSCTIYIYTHIHSNPGLVKARILEKNLQPLLLLNSDHYWLHSKHMSLFPEKET